MSRDVRVTSAQVAAALEKTAEAPEAVCALALDVLSRQAAGHLLFAGEKLVAQRAEKHGVDEATVAGADVRKLLAEGPASGAEFALVGALAVRGLDLADRKALEEFAAHADWLTLATPYEPWDTALTLFAGDDATDADAAPLWEVVAKRRPSAPSSAREVALAALHDDVLRRAGTGTKHATADEGPGEDADRIAGSLRPPPRGGLRGVLRLVSGWALLTWIVRGLGALVRVEGRGSLTLTEGAIRFERHLSLFGKPVLQGKRTMTYRAVAQAGRTTRLPSVHLLVGACLLALGVIAGGTFLFEGVRSGETYLLLFGAALVLGGAALDLGLSVLWPFKRGRVSVDVLTRPGRHVVLSGVDEAHAEAFLRALAKRLR